MKRSIGVTLSAIIGLIGSACCLLFGVVIAVTAVAPPPSTALAVRPASAIPPAVFLLAIAMFYFAFATWGIVSSIGLLRLMNWARICFLIFAGLLSIFAVFGALAVIVGMLVAPKAIPAGGS